MASIETPNLHKAVPEDSMTVGDSACMHCGVTVRLVPGGNGLVWVHEDGHVLGYNETPKSELETVTSLLVDAARAWHRNPHSAGHVLALSQAVSRYEEISARTL